MKNKFISRITFSILFFSLFACEEKYQNEILGVYGMIGPHYKSTRIFVTRAYSEENYKEFIPERLTTDESGAFVRLFTDSHFVNLTEVAPGIYEDTARVLKIKPSTRYYLTVRAVDGKSVTSECFVPSIPIPTPETSYDSIYISILTDTISVLEGPPGSYRTIFFPNSPAISFKWSKSIGVGYYDWRIGGDTLEYLVDNEIEIFESVYMFGTIARLTNEEIIILDKFDSTSAIWSTNQNNPWYWINFLPYRENNYTVYTQLQITAIDDNFMRYDISRNSNVVNGFGYFGSSSQYKKPIIVHVNSERR